MAKLSLTQLKKMIREAVRESLEEQISGLPGGSGRTGGYQSAKVPGRGKMTGLDVDQGLDLENFTLDELVAMMKENPGLNPAAKGKIKKRIGEMLKAAGW